MTQSTARLELPIALLDPESYRNGAPLAQLLYLQEHHPVYWHEEPDGGPGFWTLTHYEDIRRVLGTPKLFASFPSDAIPDGTSQGDGVNHIMLTMSDPPHHTVRRRHIAQELLPGQVVKMRAHVESIVAGILDEVCEAGECDLVTDIAGKLAAYVTADLMGLPRPDTVRMYELADRMINTKDLTQGDGLEAALTLQQYIQSVWEDRRSTPRDDLMTRYALQPVNGRVPDYEQFSLDFFLMFAAAGDTTRNVIGGGMDALFTHPDQHELMRSDPAVLESGVEEILRWAAPIMYFRRTALEDTVIHDQPVKTGDKVACFFSAANRDPAIYPDPLRFDVRRGPNNHMAFGFGPHFCLGAHLARLELRTVFREMFRRLPGLAPSAPTVWSRPDLEIAPIMVGPHAMPVRFTPTPRAG
jgi:cytochrome P450